MNKDDTRVEVKQLRCDLDQLREALFAIMQISINDIDHDMMRVFNLCDKALEKFK